MSNTDTSRSYERRDHRALTGPLRQFLTDRGMSQTELAERIGYDRKVVAHALRGGLVTWSFANEVAQALNVRFDAVAVPDTTVTSDPQEVA